MGTHPIFESDFDCLTDSKKMITRILSRQRFLSTSMCLGGGPIENTIRTKLTAAFDPRLLEIVNESGNHGFRRGRESHFNVLMVSDAFVDKRLVNRQRMVNKVLKEEISNIHALSCSLRTVSEFSD